MDNPYGYDPGDFGADGISDYPDYHGRGYDHHTAWSRDCGRISWDTDPDGEYFAGIHMADGEDVWDQDDCE